MIFFESKVIHLNASIEEIINLLNVDLLTYSYKERVDVLIIYRNIFIYNNIDCSQ